jgi:hypothetical protein
VRTRQHGERGEAFGTLIGDVPGEAAATVVPDQIEAQVAMPQRRRDRQRVGDQQIDVVSM